MNQTISCKDFPITLLRKYHPSIPHMWDKHVRQMYCQGIVFLSVLWICVETPIATTTHVQAPICTDFNQFDFSTQLQNQFNDWLDLLGTWLQPPTFRFSTHWASRATRNMVSARAVMCQGLKILARISWPGYKDSDGFLKTSVCLGYPECEGMTSRLTTWCVFDNFERRQQLQSRLKRILKIRPPRPWLNTCVSRRSEPGRTMTGYDWLIGIGLWPRPDFNPVNSANSFFIEQLGMSGRKETWWDRCKVADINIGSQPESI